MINLLPNDKKAEIRAARTNVILLRYTAIIVLALVFILGAIFITYNILGITKTSSEQRIAANDTKAEVYSATQAEVGALSASLAETRSLLDQEVRYSKALVNIGQLMPPGTVFDKLALDANSFNGTPITTKVYAKTENDAVALQQAFKASPMFSSVSFQAISEASIKGYPVSVDLTFTLNRTATQ